MNFLLDESADFRLSSFLTRLGHNVTAIAHDYPNALSDREVLSIAHQGRILITNDRDFGELVFKQHRQASGVIYLRLRIWRLGHVESRIQHVLTNYADRLSEFLVVTDSRVRVRRTS